MTIYGLIYKGGRWKERIRDRRRKRMRPLRPTNFSGTYKNPAERKFSEVARNQGWKITKRGWPDFICFRDGEVMFVEVKKNNAQRFKTAQEIIHKILKEHGINVCRWSPDNDWLSKIPGNIEDCPY